MPKVRLNEKQAVTNAASNGWYTTGYEATKETRESNSKGRGNFTLSFWLKDGESAIIRFLSDEPVNIMEHSMRMYGKFQPRTCLQGTGEVCPLCEGNYKKRMVGIYSVVDRRTAEWTDKEGKKHKEKDQVKIWRGGQRVVSTLERFLAKYGTLKGRNFEVTRVGQGTDTIYNFIPEAPQRLEIDKKDLPDVLNAVKPKPRAELMRELGQSNHNEEADVVSEGSY